MTSTFRLAMRWLHTWTGVVFGWIIFLIFFNGTAAYFRQEITTWMKPELTASIDRAKSVSGAVAFLKTKAPDAEAWTISLPDERSPVADVTWQPKLKTGQAPAREDDDFQLPPPERHALIDSNGRPVATRDTDGGDYFYQFHFGFHYLPGFLSVLLVFMASLALMVALTTGLITHRRLFAGFFTFRQRQGVRLWLNAHTTFAVLALPFHLMITYTGVGILMFFLMPWAVFATYASPQAFNSIVEPHQHIPPVTGHTASLFPVTTVLSTAEAIWGGRAERVRITNPGDASVTITIDRHLTGLVAGKGASLTFNGVTGALVHPATSEPSMAATATAAVFNLHEGHFAQPALRWLLFLSGVIGTAMIASGLILWTEKRRRKLLDPDYPRRGFRIVDVLNVAVIAGYPLATAALFWANRLLPISITSRANAEILCAFVCWGLSLVWSVVRPSRKAWVEVFGVAAVLFLSLPFVNAVTAPRGTLTNLTHGDALYIGFDLVSLALGATFAIVALSVGQRDHL